MNAERPAWVIEQSLDASAFRCCGDQDLLPFKCSACHRPFVLCYECATLYGDLPETVRHESFPSAGGGCPSCRQPFASGFQRDPHCRITFDEWTAAGLDVLLDEVPMEGLAAMFVAEAERLLGLLDRHMLGTARVRLWELRNLGEAIALHFARAAFRRTEAREQSPSTRASDVIRWTRDLPEPIERAYATLGVADILLPENVRR